MEKVSKKEKQLLWMGLPKQFSNKKVSRYINIYFNNGRILIIFLSLTQKIQFKVITLFEKENIVYFVKEI